MRIVNIMLGGNAGGIEQASLDYAVGLKEIGHEVLFVTLPDAMINEMAKAQGCQLTMLSNLGSWDRLAARKLGKVCKEFGAEAMITHGNRALTLAAKSGFKQVPLVAVSHNYQFQHLDKADVVFCITRHMQQAVLQAYPQRVPDTCYHIPNMLGSAPREYSRYWRSPPRIGALGRLVKKKGFDVWLKALARLHDRGVMFEAFLAGDGEERAALEQVVQEVNLKGLVQFQGWVPEVDAFFREIDVFCVPSLHEPFGIVVLEAMAHGLPLVVTDAEGPSEVMEEAIGCGVMVSKGDPDALADGIIQLLGSPEEAAAMGQKAREYVVTHYARPKICARMSEALEMIAAQRAA